jgi:HSP20 family protein
MQESMDKLFEETLGKPRFGEKFFERGFEPLVDVYEDNDKIELKVELPGMDQKDIQVDIEGNMLSIKGEKKFEREEKKKNYQRIERSYGSFTRTFSIPTTVDQDKVKASFKKGILTMTLPKKEEVKPKQITIDVK